MPALETWVGSHRACMQAPHRAVRHHIAAAAFLCVILALDGIVESCDPGQAVIGYDRFLKGDEAGQQSGMRRGEAALWPLAAPAGKKR